MLRIARATLADMHAHAASAYPEECCGVLLGTQQNDLREVMEAVRCSNAAAERQTRYAIDPAELIRVQRNSRERGLAIIGFYHSHPDHVAQPSRTDVEQAEWTGCSYVIIGVASGTVGDTKSFKICTDSGKELRAEVLCVE